ncbi:mitochondrial ornithine carrier protein [Polyrhizophydium stewartii]|uniref:Mitochondrial ornithine carrier protein n=1 Tax=Polyrhizophydium stewartii TaxID=2732419 RepID=A0ABR4NLH8_9FUNG
MDIQRPRNDSAIQHIAAVAAAPADVRLKKDTRLADLLFGSVSGLVGKLVEYPFDTVKVRLQAEPIVIDARSAPPSGRTLRVIRDMLAHEGAAAFFRGIAAPMVGSMVENSVLFIAYNHSQNTIRSFHGLAPDAPLSIPQLCLAGAVSGAAVSFVLTPVELVKCRLQVQDAWHQQPAAPATASSAVPAATAATHALARGPHSHLLQQCAPSSIDKRLFASAPIATASLSADAAAAAAAAAALPASAATTAAGLPPRGTIGMVAHILRTNGLAGLYRGHLGTLLREVAGGAAWFGTYEVAVKAMVDASPHVASKNDLSPWSLMAAGALAGISYNAALFPADVIKSRQQACVHDASGHGTNASFLAIGRDLYRAEGIRGLYRGFGITIARSAPTSGIIFLTYELLSRNLTVETD